MVMCCSTGPYHKIGVIIPRQPTKLAGDIVGVGVRSDCGQRDVRNMSGRWVVCFCGGDSLEGLQGRRPAAKEAALGCFSREHEFGFCFVVNPCSRIGLVYLRHSHLSTERWPIY